MKPFLCTILLLLLPITARPQSTPVDAWADWKFLLGEWTAGESSGVPGQASRGWFTLAPDLEGKILVRKNHAEYGGMERPAIVHDDLMIVYHEAGATKAFYSDSEGHVIRYNVNFSSDKRRVVLLSERGPSTPTYRLTYEDLGPGAATVLFEIASPKQPERFTKYVEAKVYRKSKP